MRLYVISPSVIFTSQKLKLNPLDLADCDLVLGPVVKFGGPRRLMRSHLLRMLEAGLPVARQVWHPTRVRNPAFRARLRMAAQALCRLSARPLSAVPALFTL